MEENLQKTVDLISVKFKSLSPHLDEKVRRLWAAAEAISLGRGGVDAVSRATGIARSTIGRGIKEIGGTTAPAAAGRVRRPGGGRKPATETQPELAAALKALVDPATRGDPERPLLWVSKSCRSLAEWPRSQGFAVSHSLVAKLLKQLGFSLQANAKTREGGESPDRNAQFEHVNRRTAEFMAEGQPVISVDTKKKENVGDFKNGGREWSPKGEPEQVRVHDFMDRKLGKAAPCGICDVANNVGWVSVGVSHDTAEFAVESIRRWWRKTGSERFPEARRLLTAADCGGSNGSRVRLWKTELQALARELGMEIAVCHLPPGTSKWNKIEHRLFSFISKNWRGRPLRDLATIVSLIASTTTGTGLKVSCELDERACEKGAAVPDEAMEALDIRREEFRGDWNYTLLPSPSDKAVNL